MIDYSLTLTENSSTSLTLAYTGPGGSSSFSFLNTSPDNWTITVLSQTILLNAFEYDFAEPEDPTGQTVNEVANNIALGGMSNMYVKSDLPIELDSGGYFGISDIIGEDGGVPIALTFNDLAAASEAAPGVPDAGSTVGMLALSFIGVIGLNRIRSLRLA